MSSDYFVHLQSILEKITLPKVKDGFDRPLESEDFSEIKNMYDLYLPEVLDILSSCSIETSFLNKNNVLVLCIVLCGENNKLTYWSSKENMEICASILAHVLRLSNTKDLLDLLTKDNSKVLKQYLITIRPCLLASSWKCYPTVVDSYCWLLSKLKSPLIDDYLGLLMPSALILSDDFVTENKITGIKCLHHLINNVTHSALKNSSYDEVIYKTLDTSFGEKDSNLILVVTSCMLSLLEKMYLFKANTALEWTHYDDLLERYLFLMCMEVNNEIKVTYIEQLPLIISNMGLTSVHHLSKIFELADEYSTSAGTVIPTLKLIDTVLEVCWPRLKHRLENIIFILVKVMYLADSFSLISNGEVTSSCVALLNRIALMDPCIFNTIVEHEQFPQIDPKIQKTIKSIRATMS